MAVPRYVMSEIAPDVYEVWDLDGDNAPSIARGTKAACWTLAHVLNDAEATKKAPAGAGAKKQ